jgi:hypothetical protein
MLAELPDWLDYDFVRNATAVLAVAAIIIVVAVIFSVKSVATRLVVVALLGAAVFGLLRYRDNLADCDKTGCKCELFGEEIQGGGCAVTEVAG